jgi:hypothetical protein
MAKFSTIDKMKLETFLQMEDGYVLDFTNKSFRNFVLDSANVDIYSQKYNLNSGSKANRLRAFWDIESPQIVAKLLEGFLEYYQYKNFSNGQYLEPTLQEVIDGYQGVIDKLKRNSSESSSDTFNLFSARENFEELANSIRNYISQGKPELALDRLHTFTTRFLKLLVSKHGYDSNRDTPLHSLMGKYLKAIKSKNIPLHPMSERILKSSISLLEAFNDVRNNSSYAHDNNILGSNESNLIVSSIGNLVRFVDQLENPNTEIFEQSPENNYEDDIPF